jgi:hypothetical protein
MPGSKFNLPGALAASTMSELVWEIREKVNSEAAATADTLVAITNLETKFITERDGKGYSVRLPFSLMQIFSTIQGRNVANRRE